MILYIDTSDFKKATFAIKGVKLVSSVYEIDSHKSHETLGFLENFLKSHKLKLSYLKSIIVNKGPGSYTGVRVGVTLAQAIGFALGIPIKAVPDPQMKKFIKLLG